MLNFYEKIKKLTTKGIEKNKRRDERKTKRQLKEQMRIIKRQASETLRFIKRLAKKGYSVCNISFDGYRKKIIGWNYISLKYYDKKVESCVIELIKKLGFKVEAENCYYYYKYIISWDVNDGQNMKIKGEKYD